MAKVVKSLLFSRTNEKLFWFFFLKKESLAKGTFLSRECNLIEGNYNIHSSGNNDTINNNSNGKFA